MSNSVQVYDRTQPYLDLFQKYVSERGMTASFKVQMVVHTKDKDLELKERVRLHQLRIVRDYENAIGDYIEADVRLPPGTFIDEVYPYLDNMEVTLRWHKQYPKNTSKPFKPYVRTQRYKAVYLVDKNSHLSSNKLLSRTDMNQQLPVVMTLQLIERSVEAMRIKTTSGNFTVAGSKTLYDLMRCVLSAEAGKVLVDSRPAIDFVEVLKPDNTASVSSLTLPSFTRVIEIPDYLQERLVGCYTSGLGCYIQSCMVKPGEYKTGMWVYPLYGVRRANSSTLEIYAPQNAAPLPTLPGWIYDNQRYVALALKPTVNTTTREAGVMSEGTGFRVADASKMMVKPITINKRGPVFERNKLNTEIIYKERDDGVNFAVNKGVYYNNLALASEIAKNKAEYFTLNISNLDHEVIWPGLNLYVSCTGMEPQDPDTGNEPRKTQKYYANTLQAVFTYSNNSANVIMEDNSEWQEMTSQASIKVCYEDFS